VERGYLTGMMFWKLWSWLQGRLDAGSGVHRSIQPVPSVFALLMALKGDEEQAFP